MRDYYDNKLKPELEGNAVIETVVEAYEKKSTVIQLFPKNVMAYRKKMGITQDMLKKNGGRN